MKIRCSLAWTLCVCLCLTLSPRAVQAQATATATTGAGATATASGSGATATASPTTNLSSIITSVPVLSITSTGASTTTVPSTSNPFAATYANPLYLGQPSLYATNFGQLAKQTGNFGKGQYLNAATLNASATGSTTTNAGTGFSTQPTPRNPSYITILGPDLPRSLHVSSQLSSDLKAMIARSSYIRDTNAIQLEVVDGIVILRGQVGSDRERRTAEGLMRLTPGVQGVQNELQIPGIAKN